MRLLRLGSLALNLNRFPLPNQIMFLSFPPCFVYLII